MQSISLIVFILPLSNFFSLFSLNLILPINLGAWRNDSHKLEVRLPDLQFGSRSSKISHLQLPFGSRKPCKKNNKNKWSCGSRPSNLMAKKLIWESSGSRHSNLVGGKNYLGVRMILLLKF